MYPELRDFFDELGNDNPRRAEALLSLRLLMEDKEYYNLDDIENYTEEKLVSDYAITDGLASFVVKKVEEAVKRLKKGKKRARND